MVGHHEKRGHILVLSPRAMRPLSCRQMPGSSSRSPKLDVFPIMASAAEKLEVPPVYRHLLYARHHTEHRSMKTDSEWSNAGQMGQLH